MLKNMFKAIEAMLFIAIIAALIRLPKILNHGVTMNSDNRGYTAILSNFYLPIFMDLLLIASIIIVIWKSFLNNYFEKEKPDKTLRITFIILALSTLIVTFSSYSTTYRELESYNHLVHHISEEVKNVTLYAEETKWDSYKYFVMLAEGVKYEVSGDIYYSIKDGFNDERLQEGESYEVPSNYHLTIEFFRDDTGLKTKILSAKVEKQFTW